MTSDRRLYFTPCPLDSPSRIIDTMSIFVLTAIFRPNSVLLRVQSPGKTSNYKFNIEFNSGSGKQ